MLKLLQKYSEEAKITVRNIRRDAMDKIKDQEKEKSISKDDSFQFSEKIQKLTDKYVEKIENIFQDKEKDILKV